MGVVVQKPGLFTTIQDLGRIGFQKYGVVAGGAMDTASHRLANLLVGNNEEEATLEMTLLGPELLFTTDVVFAICGGGFQGKIGDEVVPVGRPVFAQKESLLKIGACQIGCRGYIAFSGGIKTPLLLNSRSTYERGGFGGLHGTKLKKGDVLPIDGQKRLFPIKKQNFSTTKWYVPSSSPKTTVRVLKGREFAHFSTEAIAAFFSENYQISQDADRMGYRLLGKKLETKTKTELLSEATTFGTIQVPPNGQPIVLMADRQTTGGYPKIATVSSVDLPLLAQLKPGDQLRFQLITLEESQRLFIQREKYFRVLTKQLKLGGASNEN